MMFKSVGLLSKFVVFCNKVKSNELAKKIETPSKSTSVVPAYDPPKVKTETSNELFREEFLNSIFCIHRNWNVMVFI